MSIFLRPPIALGAATGLLVAFSGSANAITFTTNVSPDPVNPQGDIFLESVEIGDQIISEFSLVSSANIIANDPFAGGNSGAASADITDNGTFGVKVEDPSDEDIVTNLGNRYLSSIIDTEDEDSGGNFEIELTFGSPFDTLLLWERGINSDIGVIVGDIDLGTFTRDAFQPAGFSLDTREIGVAQEVGSLGIDLSEFGSVDTVTLYSTSAFNGPDFKVAGVNVGDSESIPEPGTALGLTFLAGAFLAKRAHKVKA